MPRHENNIQGQILDAIKFFFTAEEYGYKVPFSAIRSIEPSSGGQANDVEDFGRKPYDLGFFVPNTIVMFFEIKERDASGKIAEFKSEQCSMLKTLADNGVDIRVAYNSWAFSYEPIERADILKKTHVRRPEDMESRIEIPPICPAVILEEYLKSGVGEGSQALIDVLSADIAQFDNLNSMPLMIFANLDPGHAKILIDTQARDALRVMKDLFGLGASDRAAFLAGLAVGPNRNQLESMANAIFEMKDEWVSSKSLIRSRPGGI